MNNKRREKKERKKSARSLLVQIVDLQNFHTLEFEFFFYETYTILQILHFNVPLKSNHWIIDQNKLKITRFNNANGKGYRQNCLKNFNLRLQKRKKKQPIWYTRSYDHCITKVNEISNWSEREKNIGWYIPSCTRLNMVNALKYKMVPFKSIWRNIIFLTRR